MEVGFIPGIGPLPTIPERTSKLKAWDATLALLLLIPLWFGYLIATSILWLVSIPLALLVIFFFGQFLITWLGYFRHELWHNYFYGIPNKPFFRFVSLMLFSDPQIYNLAHVTHHRDLHTERDLEFFCENYSKDRKRRRRHFFAELLFGNIAWEIFTLLRFWKSPQFSKFQHWWTLSVRLAVLIAACFVADFIYPGAGKSLSYVYFLTLWLGAVVTRHDQWIEHLGIIGEGSLADRIRLVRNLPDKHWTNKIWNLFNHNDPRGHYFHHAYPHLNLRDVSGIELPEGIPTTTIPEYLRCLWHHFKTL